MLTPEEAANFYEDDEDSERLVARFDALDAGAAPRTQPPRHHWCLICDWLLSWYPYKPVSTVARRHLVRVAESAQREDGLQ